MVFVNGQKFACERPLHEIKKKGRPSTQCLHCKELRKAKQVSVRCICGKDGESYSCGCVDGAICTCCRDRAGHVVAKPGKSPSKHAVLKSYHSKHQHNTASLDPDKVGILLDSQDVFSHASPQHASGVPTIHSPDGSVSSNSSLGLSNTFNGMGISAGGPSSQYSQSPNTISSGSDHQPSISSPLGSQQNQIQPHLCFDYTSSSDYDSDHYNPPTSSYSYFPQTMTSYPVSNASDDLGEHDLNTLQDVARQPPTFMGALSSEDVGSLYTALSDFSTSTCQGSMQATPANSSVPIIKKSCCKTTNSVSSPAPSNFSQSPSVGKSDEGHEETETNGCGCAIAPNMCCCGELCACPGCLSYPNNQTILTTGYPQDSFPSGGGVSGAGDFNNANNLSIGSQPSRTGGPVQKGSCCSSGKANSDSNAISDITGNSGVQALNLSQALSLIEASSQNASAVIDNDARQALRQTLSMMGQNGMESVKMQHPTLLGDNGVLICGCGCGRPTVDCADCFRDMCEFVGESQARMMKEELEFDMAINREGGYLADLGLNMSMAMNMNLALDVDMDMDMGTNEVDGIELSPGQGSMDTPSSLIYNQDQQSEPQEQQNNQQQQQKQQKHEVQQRELQEQEQRLRLQLMEQEQMQLSQLQPSALNQLQLDFLDDEDWSFVDEIRTDSPDMKRL
ncbi:hypothetical protein BGZ80_009197 [Entomortierella chlamydospora]|uniref:Copper-fist domain-containing protein n=1 Tax=Entomortierella chlamydospora TaxID=101097 RepID=A0A9P6T443_9FUNG|nr:hypothetical protein BGZ80_009197 [Entomortierella chlamydospora]